MASTVTDNNNIDKQIVDLRLKRNHPNNAGKLFVLVEDVDDEQFYGRFTDESKVTYYHTKGCVYIPKILNSLKTDDRFRNRIFGIKDADFDHILNINHELPNMFITDTHDMETMCVCDDLEKNLHSEFLVSNSIQLIDSTMEHLRNLSYIRLYNQVNNSGIRFKGMGYESIYDGISPIDMNVCLNYLSSGKFQDNKTNVIPFPNDSDIWNCVSAYDTSNLLKLTRGHDLVYSVKIRICKHKHKSIKSNPSDKEVSLLFRASFSKERFKTTRLYNDINNWVRSFNPSLNIWQ